MCNKCLQSDFYNETSDWGVAYASTLSLPRVWVPALVGELKSHKLCSKAKKKKKKETSETSDRFSKSRK